MVYKNVFFMLKFFIFSLVFSVTANSDVLFEGYSKILSGGVHVGFIVNRYEFEPKKKVFISTSLLKTNQLGGNITESLKATAKEDLTPVSYTYTTLVGGLPKTIDATFGKGTMNAVIKDGKKVSKVNIKLPKGAFLSTFLAYVILKSPKGLTPDTKYDYQAIAEEDAALTKGIAYVKSIEEYKSIKAFRILNDFKSTKFISYITERGDVLSSKSPVQSIETELVPQSSLATNGFQIPTGLLKSLFGDVPLGIKNAIYDKHQETLSSNKSGPSKGEDIPPGKGIINKTNEPENPEKGKEK